MFEKEY